MYILNYKDVNIITFPNVGCTFIIKVCQDIEQFKHHNHSYKHNRCDIHQYTHKCAMMSYKKINMNKPMIIIYRYPHERIRSFYKANYSGDLNFQDFLNKVLDDPQSINGYFGHTITIKESINKHKGLRESKKKIFFHLSQFNTLMKESFNKDVSKLKIINETKSAEKVQYDTETLEKIKNHPRYKDDYTFINSVK